MRLFWSAAVALLVGMGFSFPASALLVEINLAGGNPNEVTRDTVTGLDWLDVTETTGVSFNSAVTFATTSFGAGWRHATGSELCVLFQNHGLSSAPAPCPGGFGPFASGRDPLIDLFGQTAGDASQQRRARLPGKGT